MEKRSLIKKSRFLAALLALAQAWPIMAGDSIVTSRTSAPLTLVAEAPAEKVVCEHFLASLSNADATLRNLSYQTSTINQFKRLHPTDGNGYLTLDITPAIPDFLRGENHRRFDWPTSKAYAFEGDPDVPHYIDMVHSRDELRAIIGDRNAAQLQALGIAMTDFVASNLPKAERDRLEAQNLEVILDLAELRVGVGTGSAVHLDWQQREGMVMIVPIYGNHTTVFDAGTAAAAKPERNHYYASLITGYERWANFHIFNCQGDCRPGTFIPRIGGQPNGVVVPNGAKAFIRSRGKEVPPDLFPQAPGILPTIHRAGEGPRMVLVFNFGYRRTSPPPADLPIPETQGFRADSTEPGSQSLIGPVYGADSPEVKELTGDPEDGP